MKAILVVLVCLFAAASAAAQTAGLVRTEDVAKMSLAREEADGTLTENPASFRPEDVPITCYIDLVDDRQVEVKLVIVAVKAVGLRPNSPIVSVRYKTNSGETQVTFTARPKGKWATGEYRADVFVDGARAASGGFKVMKE